MSFSVSDAKVTEVVRAVADADARLRRLLVEVQRIRDSLDKAVRGAGDAVAEINQEASGGDPLWVRLRERKDQVQTDLQAVRTATTAIEASIQADLP